MPASVMLPPVVLGALLDAGGDAFDASVIAVPHLLQNRASSAFSARQLGQKLMGRGVYTSGRVELGAHSVCMALCTFCSAELDAAPVGVGIRCAGCGNLTFPAVPSAAAAITPLPRSSVDGPKQAASPPPSIVMPSRAGGIDEVIGGGITLLGIGIVKFVVLGLLGLLLSCALGMLGSAFHC